MKNIIKKYFFTKAELHKKLTALEAEIYANRLLIGKLMTDSLLAKTDVKHLQEVECKVFSQFGDDGIIQYLIKTLAVETPIFIEFGVEKYTESNTRFLLINNNWKGLVIDGSAENVNFIQQDDIYWRHDLTAVESFITRENINNLFVSHGFGGDIGILSVDIDGNDYWVWQAIDSVNPVVVICEYNSVFGGKHAVSVPYQADFVRGKAHSSNLYWGASLGAFCFLANQKGYHFIGCNAAGNNAYFVRNDKKTPFKALSCEEGYVESRFRESRDANGNLTFLGGDNRLKAIADCEVIDVTTNEKHKIEQVMLKA